MKVSLARHLRIHALLAFLIAVYAAIAFILSHSTSGQIAGSKFLSVFGRFAVLVPQMIFMVLFWRLLYLTYVLRVSDRTSVLKREVVTFVTNRDRMLGGLIAAGLMTVLLVSFSQMKNQIPFLQPFSWDPVFVELDRMLHFGTLPHVYLHAIFGWHYAISFFTGLYNVWLFMMYFTLLIGCFLKPESAVRMQFLIAFVLTWTIGGNLLATAFSSVGPVYFERLGMGDTYAPLMQALKAHAATGALTVIDTQNLLWSWYTGEAKLNAISAFPSMHVASSTLMALLAFSWSRWAGLVATTFAVGIMIGSVLLGWHYAVDGYVGGLVAALSWKAAGWLARLPFSRVTVPQQA